VSLCVAVGARRAAPLRGIGKLVFELLERRLSTLDLAFQLGVRQYAEGNYEQALVHLLIANRLAPNKNVIFNIARCYEELGKFDLAYTHYYDYTELETDPSKRVYGEEALTRMGQALDSFIVEGVTTTIPFLARVTRHPDFVAGNVDTRFLERESHLLKPPT
jgi:tetratricopeptide (TPR) repeat protein